MEDRIQLADLIMGFVPAQAVSVAAELGIADLLAREAMTAEQLAAATHAHPRTLFRLLRYLESIGIFQADDQNRFSLTPMASLLRSDTQDSMRSMARVMGTCRPAQHGPQHPEEAKLFDAAMNGFHSGETEAVLDAYDFRGISTLADIGCGNGTVLTATLTLSAK